MERDATHWEEEITQLRSEVIKLRTQLHDQAQREGNDGGLELIELECKVSDLETTLKDEKERADRLQIERDDAIARADRVQATIDQLKSTSVDSDQLREQIEIQQADHAQQLAAMSAQLDALQSKKTEIEFRLDECNAQLQAANEEIENANKKVQAAQTIESELTAALNKSKESTLEIERQLTEVRAEYDQQKAVDDGLLTQLQSDIADRDKTIKTLECRVKSADSKANEAQQKLVVSVDMMAEKVKQTLGAEQKCIELEQQLNVVNTQLIDIRRESDQQADAAKSTIQQLTESNAKLSAMIDELQQSNSTTANKNKELELSINELEKMRNEWTNEKSRLESEKSSDLTNCIEQLNAARCELEAMNAICDNLKKDKSEIERVVIELKEQVVQLNATIESSRRDNDAIVEQRNAIEQQMRQAMTLFEQERQLFASVRNENIEIAAALKAKTQESQSWHDKHDSIAMQLKQRDESYSTETQRLGQMLQKVQTELLSTNAEKRRMEQDRNAFEMRETEKLKATKLEMRKEVVTIESEVANLRAELKRVDTELRVYQTKKTQLESQLEASRERESRLSGTVAESSRLKLDNEALCRDVISLRSELDTLKSKNAELEKEISELKDKKRLSEQQAPTTSLSASNTPARPAATATAIRASTAKQPKRSRNSPPSSNSEEPKLEQRIEISQMEKETNKKSTAGQSSSKKVKKEETKSKTEEESLSPPPLLTKSASIRTTGRKKAPTSATKKSLQKKTIDDTPLTTPPFASTAAKRTTIIPTNITSDEEQLYSPTGRSQRKAKSIATDGITAMTSYFRNSPNAAFMQQNASKSAMRKAAVAAANVLAKQETSSDAGVSATTAPDRPTTPSTAKKATKRNFTKKKAVGKLICSPIADSPETSHGDAIVRQVVNAVKQRAAL